ncbi:solute carrier family 35 member G1 isoform X1 [Silurus asotus]|uniref:Solute carrier family 35 member G1 isoform X1 n=1 Tax=Silurus asotus TaxID=30991 RepID=A0AAD5AKQ8_SILAS|nr:solute carrier family 35 member G1 isoform X1 [Silurus asotus]
MVVRGRVLERDEHLLHLDMDDFRSRDGTEGNEEDGVSVVPFRDEDAVLTEVAGNKEEEEEEDGESQLRGSFLVGEEDNGGSRISRKNSRKWTECWCFRVGHEPEDGTESRAAALRGEKKACPGLGLIYTLLASVLFSVAALLVKKIDGIHAVEISAIRCFFQMLFVMPAMIYYKIGFLGPRGMRVYLFLRGFLGSNAMILLYYAVLQMPLADATVITFSNPVFTSLLAWIFLKERCTIWDVIFTIFTLTGVVLIARPPFLFGGELSGIEGNYSNHVKGAIAAFSSAIAAACTMVILRKMGKNVHYYLAVWYYAVLGFIECIVVLFIIDEWAIPSCGWDRWNLMAIGVLGIGGQTFLTKALQVEKAGPVALMRTTDVVLAFILQFLFLSRKPTWWSICGALCVISSTTGVAIRKWFNSTRHKS